MNRLPDLQKRKQLAEAAAGKSSEGEIGGERIAVLFYLPSFSHGIGAGFQQRVRGTEQSTQMQVQEAAAEEVQEER